MRLTLATLIPFLAAACAHAEPLTLSCRFGSLERFDLTAEGVSVAPDTPMSAEAFLSLDFEANTFAFSRSSGPMNVTPERIVMMAQDESGAALWELDRQTGGLVSFGVDSADGATQMQRWRGQCEPESGTPF